MLRFPLIVGVVFIHAGYNVGVSYGELAAANGGVAEFVENLISQGVAQTAVPLFFLMSGYFFFLGFDASRKAYQEKLSTRTRTLLIPFLLWNLALLLGIAIAQAMPGSRPFLSGKNAPIASYGIVDCVAAIFGIGRDPIGFQFWFIRDLMLLVLLTPVIGWANKHAPLLFLGVLSVGWLIPFGPFHLRSSEALLFFSLGAYCGTRKKSLFALDKYAAFFLAAYAILLVAGALFRKEAFAHHLYRPSIAIGVAAVLCSTKYLARSARVSRVLLSLDGVSFFVFAAFEPLFLIMHKVTSGVLRPESSAMLLAIYFTLPILVITFLLFVFRVLSRISPRVLGFATGGRGLGRNVAEGESIGIAIRVHAATSSPHRNSSAPPKAVIARRIE